MRLGRRLLMLGLILPLAIGSVQADPRHDNQSGASGYKSAPSAPSRPVTRTPSTDDYRKPAPIAPPVARTAPPPDQDYRKPAPIAPPVARTAPSTDDHRPPIARTAPPPDQDYRKPAPVVPPVARAAPDDDYRKPPPPVARAAPDQDYRRPTSPAAQTPPPARSATDVAIAKGQSGVALRQFDADQQKFKAPPVAPPVNTQAAREAPIYREYGNRWKSADDYYTARRRAETQLPPTVNNYFSAPPAYVTAGPPAFGNLSSAFLGAGLGMIGTAAWDNWMYSHRRDRDVEEWRRYMDRQAQSDPEVQAKLREYDARMAALEAQKAPITNKLPDGVDPSLVVAPHTVMLATANDGFNWIWIWLPLLLIGGAIGFVVVCVRISRSRQRIA